MKIDKAILSTDDNPLYIDFWPSISKVWKEKFNITPVLALIGNDVELFERIDRTYGEVFRFDILENIPVYLQTLWVRYWITGKFKDEVCIISDIDMIPLSKWYFIDQISDIDNDDYVHLNPCYDEYGTLPSCYHVAKGGLFKEMWNLHEYWKDSIENLYGMNLGRNPGGHLDGKNQWFADEKYSSDKIFHWKEKNENRVNFINRQNDRRIDRSYWNYDERLIKEGYYYDSHSIRPYSIYKSEIEKIIELI